MSRRKPNTNNSAHFTTTTSPPIKIHLIIKLRFPVEFTIMILFPMIYSEHIISQRLNGSLVDELSNFGSVIIIKAKASAGEERIADIKFIK